MKKRIYAVISALALVITLTACANDLEVEELRNQVAELEEQVRVLEEGKNENIDNRNEAIEITDKDTNVTDDEENTAILTYLNNQIMSQNYDSMKEVAECKQATEEHLISVANYCKKNGYDNLAQKIINNENCTTSVVDVLSTSTYYDILKCVAKSDKASEYALKNVAVYCVEGGYDVLAKIVIDNVNCTDNVIEVLSNSNFYDILKNVANTDKASETALKSVAQYCVSCRYSALSGKVIDNPNSTGTILEILSKSEDYDILELVAISSKSSEEALKNVANYCAKNGYENLAKKLANNSNCTVDVMQRLVTSRNSNVVSIGHVWIENH